MKKLITLLTAIFLQIFLISLVAGSGNSSSKAGSNSEAPPKDAKFSLIDIPAEKKVEIRIDGELFTSYMYPDNIAKPVLWPINTLSGKVLSRGFPLESLPGERVDHPHHVGHWMNYGDVNGLDFWNNSTARSKEDAHKYGSIYHTEVTSIKPGNKMGVLEVVSEWKSPDGTILLVENTKFIVSTVDNTIVLDRITTLKAQDKEVSFKDNKEGMYGLRVTRAMELPSKKAAVFTDAHGNPTETKVLDNTGVNGNYLSSEGIEGKEVWGTRGRWMNLYSTIEDEPVALVIIDHPENVGYPTYWHARDYGLFAANPLGQSVFTKGEKVLDYKLAPNQSVTFKYRLLVHSGDVISAEKINSLADKFAGK